VVNKLAEAVEVCYQREMNDERVLTTLNPGETFDLPLGIAEAEYQHRKSFVSLLRFYDPVARQHLYVTDPTLIRDRTGHTCFFEGAIGYLYGTAVGGSVPVWADLPMHNRNRLFTNRCTEGGSLPAKYRPLSDDQLARQGMYLLGYANGAFQPKTLPLVSYWCSKRNNHLFTTDLTEVGKEVKARERGKFGYLCVFLFLAFLFFLLGKFTAFR
jgi:hypothetical protein